MTKELKGNKLIRLEGTFFERDVLEVAPELLGKFLCRQIEENTVLQYRITETEAYHGNGDLACHASKGRTERTEVMFQQGGLIYVYLIYGMYWMFNIVTGKVNEPQAVLIRGLEPCYGPGRLTRLMGIDKSFYGEDLNTSGRIWLMSDGSCPPVKTGKRIGVDYAGDWKDKEWRFFIPGFSK